MRLLIVDECIAPGGVETLRLNLLPELAKLCEEIVWMLPLPYGEMLRSQICQLNIPNLVVENLYWPRGSARQIWAAALRRASLVPALKGQATKLMRKSVDLRIQALAQKHRSVCCLSTFVFSQPPPISGLPLAGFVCDVNPILPEWIRNNIVKWVSAARAMLAISEFTREDLCHLAPASRPKIHAVPIAAPVLSVPASGSICKNDFYFPAAANEHKGHLVLFKACLELARRGLPFRLVLSGPGTENFLADGRFDRPTLEEARQFLADNAKDLNGSITVAGNVPATEVDDLYNSTACVVLPSRYEGFGLPLVEALQRGKEVVCSDIPPYREQLARYDLFDQAQLVPPGDVGRLADAMEQILKRGSAPRLDAAERNRRLARWTWADVARSCYEHLRSISEPNPIC
jgi:glycosyltransferase involved in cell wall biosynthesis